MIFPLSSIKFEKQGIVFEYHDDIIMRFWPWKKEQGSSPYYSVKLENRFGSFSDYWKQIGVLEQVLQQRSSKLSSYDWEDILLDWLRGQLHLGSFIALYDLDLSKRPAEFWARIPPEKRIHFNKDLVIMKCKDLNQAYDIADSIAPAFGKAVIIEDGQIL